MIRNAHMTQISYTDIMRVLLPKAVKACVSSMETGVFG